MAGSLITGGSPRSIASSMPAPCAAATLSSTWRSLRQACWRVSSWPLRIVPFSRASPAMTL
jgi:hypothetical protein